MTGAVIGGSYNAYYTNKVCATAYNLYRERFLIEKYGPDGILDRDRIYNSIRLGVPGTAMPPWQGVFTDAQINALLEFVANINDPGLEKRAKEER